MTGFVKGDSVLFERNGWDVMGAVVEVFHYMRGTYLRISTVSGIVTINSNHVRKIGS